MRLKKHIERSFSEEDDFCTTKKRVGVKYVFRGIAVKEWVALPQESIDFRSRNKVLVVVC